MSPSDNDEEDDRTIIGGALPTPARRGDVRRPTPASPRASSVQSPPQVERAIERPIAVPLQAANSDLSNPLLSSALPYLSLLSRVRMGEIEISPEELRDSARRYIKVDSGATNGDKVPQNQAQLAKVCLAAMADDVCQTLPGSDIKERRPLTQEMFGVESGSQSFFGYLKTATDAPMEYSYLLELMLVCLGLGYQGRYRGTPKGPARVEEKRALAWVALNSVRSNTRKLSHRWKPVIVKDVVQRQIAPLWMIAGVAAAIVTALFISLANVLTNEAQALQSGVRGLHQLPPVAIQRTVIPQPQKSAEPTPPPPPPEKVEVYTPPPPPQFARIQEALNDIGARVEVLGDYVVIRLGSELQFGSGGATLQQDLTPFVRPIAAVLNQEPGAIVIEGHSDNIPLSGVGVYKTNEALSEARALAVGQVLAPMLDNASRISVVGIGAARPLSFDNTPEARLLNRRVEILLQRENTQ